MVDGDNEYDVSDLRRMLALRLLPWALFRRLSF
jgi:hypothetical protein